MPTLEKSNPNQPFVVNRKRCETCNATGVVGPPDYASAAICDRCGGSGLVLMTDEEIDAYLRREPDTSKDNS